MARVLIVGTDEDLVRGLLAEHPGADWAVEASSAMQRKSRALGFNRNSCVGEGVDRALYELVLPEAKPEKKAWAPKAKKAEAEPTPDPDIEAVVEDATDEE